MICFSVFFVSYQIKTILFIARSVTDATFFDLFFHHLLQGVMCG
uniref:Uncharacterized protein n=1 Tax=Anguilla anguilla TaxID=7936 RepID=A0A0E9VK99_ANGAN